MSNITNNSLLRGFLVCKLPDLHFIFISLQVLVVKSHAFLSPGSQENLSLPLNVIPVSVGWTIDKNHFFWQSTKSMSQVFCKTHWKKQFTLFKQQKARNEDNRHKTCITWASDNLFANKNNEQRTRSIQVNMKNYNVTKNNDSKMYLSHRLLIFERRTTSESSLKRTLLLLLFVMIGILVSFLR